jgi:hypothetical protein
MRTHDTMSSLEKKENRLEPITWEGIIRISKKELLVMEGKSQSRPGI